MTSKMMKLWRWPRDYFGAEWPDYYVAIGRHRDSSLLDNSNFEVFEKAMKEIGEADNWQHEEACWQIVRNGHWAVGWVEWIAIHKDAQAHIDKADELLARLADYPVLDEENYSNRQYESALSFITEAVSFYARRSEEEFTEERKQVAIEQLMSDCEDFGGDDGDGYYPSDEEVELALAEEVTS